MERAAEREFSRDAADYYPDAAEPGTKAFVHGIPLDAIVQVIENGELAPMRDQREDTVKLKGRYRSAWYYVVVDPDDHALVTGGVCG